MLRQVVILSGLVLAGALATAQFAAQSDGARAAPPPLAAATAPIAPAPVAASSYGSSSIVIMPDARGHFQVDARVDASPMAFMVDTGATVIALRERDAAALAIHPAARDYSAEVKTANGSARAAPVELGMVEIGNIMVRNVAALVMPDQKISARTSLASRS